MTAAKTTRCRYCGAELPLADMGRPRAFCSDTHRKLYGKATAGAVQALLDDVAAGRELCEVRDLHNDLHRLMLSCRSLAGRLERTGDVVRHARVAAVARELERTLVRHFGDREAQP